VQLFSAVAVDTSRNMKKLLVNRTFRILGLIIAMAMSLFPEYSSGSQFLQQKTVSITKTEQIDDDVYIFANYCKMNGIINGDFSAFCYDINTIGDIAGNANLIAYRVDLYGKVAKSARMFGNLVNCNGEITGNMLLLGNEISVGEKAIVGRDLNCTGSKISIDGIVKGNLKASGARVIISGVIEGNATINADKILIIPPANIKGNLIYSSEKEATIEDGAIIGGERQWQIPEKKEDEEDTFSILSLLFKFGLFITAFLTGVLFIYLFKAHTFESSSQILSNFWVTLARGCLAFIIFTAGVVVLIILLVGIPLGVILICLGVILFYLGKIYTSIALGRFLFKALDRNKTYAMALELLLGLLILSFVFWIPYLGWIIYITAFIVGAGAAISGFLILSRRLKAVAASSQTSI
jgi:cytoskeletal protein CcmA (bactofilin family)